MKIHQFNGLLKHPNSKVLFVVGTILSGLIFLDILNGSSTILFLVNWFPFSLGVLLVGLFISLLLKYDHSWNTYKIFVVIIIVSGVMLFLEPRINQIQYRSIKHELRSTFLAILRYENDNGKLPDGFGDLIPQYLSSVPKSSFGFYGTLMEYEKVDKENFSLHYRVKDRYWCQTDNHGGQGILGIHNLIEPTPQCVQCGVDYYRK